METVQQFYTDSKISLYLLRDQCKLHAASWNNGKAVKYIGYLTLLSTGSTHENQSRHNRKIVDWDVKSQMKRKKKI